MKDEEIKLPVFTIDVDDEFLWDRFIDWVNASSDKRYKLAEAVDDELLRLLHDYARETVRLNLH